MSQSEESSDTERRRLPWVRWLARPLAPLVVGVLVLGLWEALIAQRNDPTLEALLPRPTRIASGVVENRAELLDAAWVTLRTTLVALAAAVATGVPLALLLTSSRWVELSLFPYAVALQVTPLVAIAPLLIIWIGVPWVVMLVCAWIVAFFPILSGTVVGLRSADRGLVDLFRLYGATRWQRFRRLLIPSALPYFLSSLRVSANLALVGAVVGELVTGGQADRAGLASIVAEAQYRTDMDLAFSALGLVALLGVGLYFATHTLSQGLLGGWHESALPKNR